MSLILPAGIYRKSKNSTAIASVSLARKCDTCRKKKKPVLQRKATSSGLEAAPPIVHDVLSSPGAPLDPATRAFMEPRFGHDFSQIRVHNDSKAAESARAVNSLAYTMGRDVVFDTGQYAPHTNAGRKLMAHELTHTVQQHHAVSPPAKALAIGEPDDMGERQARAAAKQIDENRAVTVTPSRGMQQLAREASPGGATTPSPAGASGTSRPVFFCSKSVALGGKHAFFRAGGSGTGNSTFELEHDEYGEHCQCGIQGHPTRDYPEDRDSSDATCVAAPAVTEACLLNNWARYPIGKYCALGPNSNTYARFLADRCGATGLHPPGWLPGFDDAPPLAGTANPALDARITFLPGACGTIECDDDTCHRIYF